MNEELTDLHNRDFQKSIGISPLQVLLMDLTNPMTCTIEDLRRAIDSVETSRAARAFLEGVFHARTWHTLMQKMEGKKC